MLLRRAIPISVLMLMRCYTEMDKHGNLLVTSVTALLRVVRVA